MKIKTVDPVKMGDVEEFIQRIVDNLDHLYNSSQIIEIPIADKPSYFIHINRDEITDLLSFRPAHMGEGLSTKNNFVMEIFVEDLLNREEDRSLSWVINNLFDYVI